jgi:hypothetical protein
MGLSFRVAPRALGTSDGGVLTALAHTDAGKTAELAFDEPSPWGGRLIAPSEPEGDLPSGPLIYVSPDGKLHELKAEGKKLDFKGAVAYGPDQLLLIDGSSAGVDRRVFLAARDGTVRTVPGVEPPCTWWPAAK